MAGVLGPKQEESSRATERKDMIEERNITVERRSIVEERALSLTIHEKDRQLARDKALAQRVVQRDPAAFQGLYKSYAPKLLRRLLSLLGGDQAQAEDCLQQVFFKCYERIHDYRGEGTLLAWLHTITTNVLRDYFRSQQRWRLAFRSFLADPTAGQRDAQPLPERLFHHEELKETVHRTLQKLDYRKRIAILLCDFEGLKLEEAAKELDIAVGTMGSRLHVGRRELRDKLMREGKRMGLDMEDWCRG